MRALGRIALGAAAGALAWYAGLRLLFGPAQGVLTDPVLQSGKFLRVFFEIPPTPRVASDPWLLPLGLFVVCLGYSAVYRALAGRLGRGRWRSGAAFGAIAWALAIPWFEFYLPWNVMHEPMPLVLLEGALWLLLLQGVGLALAAVHGPARDPPQA